MKMQLPAIGKLKADPDVGIPVDAVAVCIDALTLSGSIAQATGHAKVKQQPGRSVG